MIQKVRKGEYAQFLLQELGPQRAHAFQIFDRVTQYCYDILYFFTKIKTRVINFAAILNRYSIPMTRKLSVTAIAGILLVIAASGANAQFKEGFNDVSMRIPQGKDTPEIKAAIWLPGGYDTARRYPLIIYAQPNTEADSGANDLLNEGLPAVLKGGFRPPFDCIVICPRGEAGIPQPGWLSGMIGDAVGQLPIDSTRIYLTGMAEGGYLCFGSQLNLSPDVARKIAAICVVSGNTENLKWTNLDAWAKNRTPLWIIIGQADERRLHQNIALANSLNQQQPGLVRVSMPPDVGPMTALNVYDGTFNDNGPDLWKWFHQFTIAAPAPSPAARQPHTRTPPATKPAARIARAKPTVRKTRILLEARDQQVYCTDVDKAYNPKPGDTLVIPTGLLSALIRGFSGSREKPIVVQPEDSGWIGGYSSYALVITNAKYFKVTGFHLDGRNKSDIDLAIGQQTSDYEVSRCVIRNSVSMGLVAKQDPDSTNPLGSYPAFSIRNVQIHDIAVRNTGTEGFYIGYTFDKKSPLASPLVNVDIHNIDIDSTGWDGLQLSNCQQVSLHDVSIRDYGLKNQDAQRSGLLLGGMVTLRDNLSNVSITQGSGVGLLIFGRGLMRISNVRLRQTGMTPGEHAIYVNDYRDLGYGLPPLQLEMKNIRVDGTAGRALVVENDNKTMLPGLIEHLSYVHAKGIRDDVDKIRE